jgi:hypothetical protein
VDADDDRHAGEPDPQPDQPKPAGPLARGEAHGEQRDEDRHRGVGNGGDPGIDVRLAPRYEQERGSHADDADEGARRDRRPSAPQAAPDCDEAEQADRRQQKSQLDHGRRCEVSQGDLDEHVGRAPDRRQRHQERQIRAAHMREPTEANRGEAEPRSSFFAVQSQTKEGWK